MYIDGPMEKKAYIVITKSGKTNGQYVLALGCMYFFKMHFSHNWKCQNISKKNIVCIFSYPTCTQSHFKKTNFSCGYVKMIKFGDKISFLNLFCANQKILFFHKTLSEHIECED
jgi:hypothetical protein